MVHSQEIAPPGAAACQIRPWPPRIDILRSAGPRVRSLRTMKLLAALALAATCALPLAALRPGVQADCAALHVATDDPPPVDCPFCGGDPVAHRLRLRALLYRQASYTIQFWTSSARAR